MKTPRGITPASYLIARRLYHSREVIGWLITAVFCFLLWLVNHDNQQLSADLTEAQARLAERDRQIAALHQVNAEILSRYQRLESGNQRILQSIQEGRVHASQR